MAVTMQQEEYRNHLRKLCFAMLFSQPQPSDDAAAEEPAHDLDNMSYEELQELAKALAKYRCAVPFRRAAIRNWETSSEMQAR
jgi:hypothetical protein